MIHMRLNSYHLHKYLTFWRRQIHHQEVCHVSYFFIARILKSLFTLFTVPKPNTLALVSFNLPISKGNKIHCLDILHALVKHVLGHVDESDTFKQLQDQMDVKFKKQFPTRKELEIVSSTRIWKRQERAAKTIQTAWREYLRQSSLNQSNIFLIMHDSTSRTDSNVNERGLQCRVTMIKHKHQVPVGIVNCQH